MSLGALRLVSKDWRAAVDAAHSGLRRWELHSRLRPPLPRAAAVVEGLCPAQLACLRAEPAEVPAAGASGCASAEAAANDIPCATVS